MHTLPTRDGLTAIYSARCRLGLISPVANKMLQLTVAECGSGQRDRVVDLYHACSYHGGISAHDGILVATNRGALVGAVRLCSENGVIVLRGMQVLPEFRRMGVGTGLLRASVARIGSAACYTIPWRRLERFYGSEGFRRCASTEVPPFLASRFEEYSSRGMDVILMTRISPPDRRACV